MTERNGIPLSGQAARHAEYFETAEWRDLVGAMFSDGPSLEQCLKYIDIELREAMDSLEPMAPDNGRALDGFHAGCAILRAWGTLTGTRFRQKLQTIAASADELDCVIASLDARNVPTEMAPGQPYSVHGRVLAALDGADIRETRLCRNCGEPAHGLCERPASPEAQPGFALSMETRGIVIRGEAFVVEDALNIVAAWADLSEKLEALGIRVTRLDDPPTREDIDGTILNGRANPTGAMLFKPIRDPILGAPEGVETTLDGRGVQDAKNP